MNRPIRRALTVAAATTSVAFAALTTSACAAQPILHKANVITIPSPDQVSDVYRADQCPWLRLLVPSTAAATGKMSAPDGHPIQDSDAAVYSMLIAPPLCAAEYSMVGN